MSKGGKKPRKREDTRIHDAGSAPKKKKEKDWSFDDIVRSKTRRH